MLGYEPQEAAGQGRTSLLLSPSSIDDDRQRRPQRLQRHKHQRPDGEKIVDCVVNSQQTRRNTRTCLIRSTTRLARVLFISDPISPHSSSFHLLYLLHPRQRTPSMSLTAESAQQPQPTASAPSSSTFTFKAPYPPASTSAGSQGASKQRRVSLALPNTPRVVPAWNFRDDTTIDAHIASTAALAEKKGKMRRAASSASDTHRVSETAIVPEKRQRKKWSEEETKMLVNGCNIVSSWHGLLLTTTNFFLSSVGCRQLEGHPQ